ncbi:pyridoxal phosphate-dependent transferase [Aspergillus crustosus]
MSFSGRRVSILRPSNNRRFSVGKELSTNELQSETHRQFRTAHEGHRPHAGLDASRASTGVVWCTERATEHGYAEDPTGWANLGQGAPEADDEIEGSFPRPESIPITSAAREYGPTAGIKPLRAAVARLYNEHYRQGKESQYTWENVCIVPGGRAGLIRIAAILGNSYLSFPIPDYSAYSEMLSLFKNIAPIPMPLAQDDHYHIHPNKIAEEIARGTSVILTSNPRNPTGHFVGTEELAEIQDICRDRATLILDEFYGGYNYTTDCDGTTISGASNVVDVNKDDVLLIDGLTKRFRLPGWRIAWVVGPKEFVDALGSAGSYLDGGANAPFQEAAIPMLEPSLVHTEMKALQLHFREKRDFVLKRLHEIGFRVQDIPQATFYVWLDLTSLDPPLPKEANISDGLNFFNALLTEKVIVVPGIFFDLNPAKRRDLFDSPCHHFVRLSYGPKMDVLKMGLDGIERVIRRAREVIRNHAASFYSTTNIILLIKFKKQTLMPPPPSPKQPSTSTLLRIANYTVFTFLALILLCLIILTPADAIYQCLTTHRLTNIFIITGGYVVTFLLAALIYATRIYTNRTVLGGIPKAWIPVEREDGLGRNLRGERRRNTNRYGDRDHETGEDEDWEGKGLLRGFDFEVNPGNPPWGVIEHAGWSTPGDTSDANAIENDGGGGGGGRGGEDAHLPHGLCYRTVIRELPHLIEAKATEIPDTRIVEILRRPAHASLRAYLTHLSSLSILNPPESALEFLSIYERARFCGRDLHESEGMHFDIHEYNTHLLGMGLDGVGSGSRSIRDTNSIFGSQNSESVIGPSDEEGETETDTLGSQSRPRSSAYGYHFANEYLDGAKTGSLSHSHRDTDRSRSRRSGGGQTSPWAPPSRPPSASASASTHSLHLRPVRSNTSIPISNSGRSFGSGSARSGGSVIRLADARTESGLGVPYIFGP